MSGDHLSEETVSKKGQNTRMKSSKKRKKSVKNSVRKRRRIDEGVDINLSDNNTGDARETDLHDDDMETEFHGVDSLSDNSHHDDVEVGGLKWRMVKSILQMCLVSDKKYADDIFAWVDELNQAALDRDQVFRSTQRSYLYRLMILLRECLLTRRWSDALYVLTNIVKEQTSSNAHSTIWHVGCELMCLDSDSSNMLDQFVNQVKQLSTVQTKQVVLEYVLYLLTSDRISDAEHAVRNIQVRTRGRKKQADRQDWYTELMQNSYEGLIYYSQWLQNRIRLDEYMNQPFGSSSQVKFEQAMKHLAEKAIKCFQKICIQKEMVLDIFIIKYVQLLEYYDQHEEAKEVLQIYKTNNPANPNAHKFYYHYLKRHQGGDTREDTAVLIECLGELCDSVPSDRLALELHELMCNNGHGASDTLYILFDYLDYACRKNDITAWQKLAGCLITIFERRNTADASSDVSIRSNHDNDMAAVDKCWQIRRSWWTQYHWQDTATDDLDLLANKATVACLLKGKEYKFVTCVASKLKSGTPAEETLKKALCLV